MRKHDALHTEMTEKRDGVHVGIYRFIIFALALVAVRCQHFVKALANAVVFRFHPKPRAHIFGVPPLVDVVKVVLRGVKRGHQIPRTVDFFGDFIINRRVKFPKPAERFCLLPGAPKRDFCRVLCAAERRKIASVDFFMLQFIREKFCFAPAFFG